MLLIDNSNTRTKFALGGAGGLQPWMGMLPTREIRADSMDGLLAGRDFDAVVLCSVVPQARDLMLEWLADRAPGIPVHLLSHQSPIGVEIDFPEPEQIGADRLANAAATAVTGDFPAIVIDFGTAVTFDVISSRPAYCGGVIAPGLGAMTGYLAEKTALLPAIDLAVPHSAIGRSTVEAMKSGAYHGYRGMVRGILSALGAELEGRPRVWATGGDAAWISRGMEEIDEVSPRLTLEGIRLVGSRVFG